VTQHVSHYSVLQGGGPLHTTNLPYIPQSVPASIAGTCIKGCMLLPDWVMR
jgi:hypothetical protein